MTDGGQDFNLGHVVGDAGEKGDDGSTVWNTSTAPTYANSKYTFTISNLSGKTGLEIAVNDIIFYSTYYYIVSTVNTTTVDCTTRVSIKGSDASVTIVDNLTSTSSTSALSAKQGKALNDNKVETSAIATSWGGTTSDSKVPSEKLAKTSLDAKQATLVSGTNIKTINNNSILGSGNLEIQSSSVDIATSWGSTLSDTKVPSEKLTKNSLDSKADASSLATVATSGDYDDLTDKPTIPSDVSDLTDTNNTAFTPKSHSHGNLTNDGKVGSASGKIITTTTGGAIQASSSITKSMISDFPSLATVATSGDYDDLTDKPTIPSKISDLTNDSDFIEKSNTSGLIKNDGTIDTTSYSTFSGSYNDLSNKPTIPSKISDLTNDSDFIETSSTAGLIKNDGTIDTNTYLTSSAISGMLTSSDIADNLTTNDATKVLSAKQGKVLNTNKIETSAIATSFSSTTSDSKVPSEKLTKTELDKKITKASTATGLLKDDGTVMTSGTGASNWAIGNHTHGNILNDGSMDSSSSVSSVSNTNAPLIVKQGDDYEIAYGVVSAGFIKDVYAHSNIGSSSEDSQATINGLIDSVLATKITKSNSATGLLKDDGTVMTSGTGASNWAIGNHTHGNIDNDGGIYNDPLIVDICTNLVGLVGTFDLDEPLGIHKMKYMDSLPSSFVKDSTAHSNIGSSANATQSTINTKIDDALATKITKSNSATGLLKDDGTVMTSGTGSTNWAVGNHTHSGYVSATKVTSWQSTPSDSNVPSEKLVKDYVDGLIGSAISYIVGSGN